VSDAASHIDRVAIFGTVFTKTEYTKWVDDLVAEESRAGLIAPDEAAGYRTKLLELERGVIPMTICVDSEDRIGDLKTLLPETWGGVYTEHRWQVDPADLLKLPFTHIILLAGPPKTDIAWPLYFDGTVINGPFAIITWDERTKAYRYIHCGNCAHTIVQWITQKQDAWKPSLDLTKATHDAPERAQ
jgi:hypothetical protein